MWAEKAHPRMVVKRVTGKAPVNMALIKYWGKRDEELIIPLNDSISVTFSPEDMWAQTTIAISPKFEEDEFYLNNGKRTMDNPRLEKCIKLIKNLAKEKNPREELDWKMRIVSKNNFPTEAGLASSAAGYACLVFVLAKLYEVDVELSRIARQGSGSACRSMYGGFVQWQAGSVVDGSDCFARQIFPPDHWPELECLVLVVNDRKKKTSSTNGMRAAVETSEFLKHRVENCVPGNLKKLQEATKNKNFEAFAEIIMRDSNQFHAVCLDTYPPEIYLSDVSRAIIFFVHQYNATFGHTKLAYTFDAGPNACLFVLKQDVLLALRTISIIFSSYTPLDDFFRGIDVSKVAEVDIQQCPEIKFNFKLPEDSLRYVIHTKVGDGPSVMSDEASLISDTGVPLHVNED